MTQVNGVLVCGGAGFIGSHLVDRLLTEGHSVEVVDDLSVGSLANLASARLAGGKMRFHNLDVSAPEFAELVALRRPSVVFHLALLPCGASRNNEVLRSATLRLNVLEAARRYGVTIVVLAQPAGLVYGGVPARQLPVKEGRKSEPMGVAHVMANTLVDLLTVYRERYDVEFTVLAMTNVYGPRQRPGDGVVAAFANAVVNQTAPVVCGNGRQTRDFIYIDDAVDALTRSINRGGGLVINIGTGVQTTIKELWQLIGRDTTLQESYESARSGDLQRNAVNTTRARIQLGWSPWTTLASGVDELLGRKAQEKTRATRQSRSSK
ncbi:MAG: NAD-dependent epimerase/dehydratase family protein [Actinomycetota bacterium]